MFFSRCKCEQDSGAVVPDNQLSMSYSVPTVMASRPRDCKGEYFPEGHVLNWDEDDVHPACNLTLHKESQTAVVSQ